MPALRTREIAPRFTTASNLCQLYVLPPYWPISNSPRFGANLKKNRTASPQKAEPRGPAVNRRVVGVPVYAPVRNRRRNRFLDLVGLNPTTLDGLPECVSSYLAIVLYL